MDPMARNGSPPWAAYHALMDRRLVALYKFMGVCPVVIGESICRLMANLVQTITAHHAKEACGNNNLCDRLKSGIEGVVHASKRAFGRNTPPNAVSSNSHPKEANGLDILWEGVSESTDPPGRY